MFLIGILRVARSRSFFFTFSMSRAGAQKKKSALFEKRFSLPVRAAPTEREKRARRQRLARAKGHAALFFSFFVSHGAGPTSFCIARLFPGISPRTKIEILETVLV